MKELYLGGYMSGYYCVQGGVDDKFYIVLGVHSVFESSIGGGGYDKKNGIAQYDQVALLSSIHTLFQLHIVQTPPPNVHT